MNSKLLLKYANKWIALSADRKKVIASAKSIGELDKKLPKTKQKSDVIFHHVLPINGTYSPQCLN